jgi:hypothetical protein
MPSYRIEFKDSTSYKLTASDQKDAVAKAQHRYRRKTGKAGEIKRIR